MAQSYGVNKNPQDVDLDGDGIIDAHERAYGQQQAQGGKMDAQSMGAAAAMQAMKSFMGQGGGQAQQSSGGNMQSKVGLLGRYIFLHQPNAFRIPDHWNGHGRSRQGESIPVTPFPFGQVDPPLFSCSTRTVAPPTAASKMSSRPPRRPS